MSIMQRFSDIMKSNINTMLDKAENPAKMVDQYLLDARHDLAECKKETANVMAAEKAAQRDLDECKANIEKYASAARAAVQAGNDDDARKLLQSKQRYESQLPSLTKNYEAASASADKMRQMFDKLTADIADLEARKATVKSTVAVAKAQEAVNKVGSRSDYGTAAADGLARMEQKANERLDRATASAELDQGIHQGEDLVAKYDAGGSASVDDELERLKAELNN